MTCSKGLKIEEADSVQHNSDSETQMNKPPCKNLQIIDVNKIGKFGICKNYSSGSFCLTV